MASKEETINEKKDREDREAREAAGYPEPVVFEVVEPDPVEEVKPVKTRKSYAARMDGGFEIGGYDNEKGAEEAGATYLATHPDTSFVVVVRYHQAD